jgi:hypothetical protein
VSNRSDTVRARGWVRALNEAARLDDDENATLLKAIASVGPTERGDPLPSQDYPSESYERWAGGETEFESDPEGAEEVAPPVVEGTEGPYMGGP